MAYLLQKNRLLKNFDILGTQEICNRIEQFEYFQKILLKQKSKVYAEFAQANPNATDSCRSGQMILSRYPIVNSGTFALPVIRPGGKIVLWVDILLPDGKLVRIYNLHLDNRGKSFFAEKGRLKQTKAFLEKYLDWRKTNPDQPAIVMGDFNTVNKLYDPWKREATIFEMWKHFSSSLTKYQPTHITMHQTDWIFFDKIELVKSHVVYQPMSDHYPVSADFVLPD